MTHLLRQYLDASPPLLVRGEGIYLFDRDGTRYLDACGGVVVTSLGHGHPRVVAAIQEQAARLCYAHAGAFTSEPAEALADFLIERSPGMGSAYFLSGGSEIVEVALKTAYQFHVERGEPGRQVFVSRRMNYHGSTLGALAVTGNPARRSIFPPILGRAEQVSPCYAYRDQREGETDADYVRRLAAELEERILTVGPDKVAAFLAETVVGSTAGAVPAVAGYFRAIRSVCDRYGVLLILDEVMCGMGRTGRLFACEEEDVRPDLLLVGKGLGAGYVPISAMLVSPRVHDAIRAGSGVLRNGQTFVHHPLACAAALAVQRTIAEEDLLENVRQRGRQLRERLRDGLGDHPHVGDVRGRGLFLGIELVADRGSKAPFAPERRAFAAVKAEAWKRGLLVYPMGGTIDGTRGDHVLVAPPFICTEHDIDTIADLLIEVLRGGLP